MASKEGIIKFDIVHTPGKPLPPEGIVDLNRWRTMLLALNLIGQDPNRYGGYGYGNLSRRLPPFPAPLHRRPFAITGTQTGGLPELGPKQYAIVTECEPERNRIVATGPIKPSSESLTHGVVYDLDAHARFVIHVHSPEIWHRAAKLQLPTTDPNVPYGSPEMAREVQRLFAETYLPKRRVFSMGGHEDGIVAFGRTSDSAGAALLAVLRQATQ